jgi:hypothetical protein
MVILGRRGQSDRCTVKTSLSQLTSHSLLCTWLIGQRDRRNDATSGSLRGDQVTADPTRMTVRAFLEQLDSEIRVRVGADHEGPGIHDWRAGELLDEWLAEPNPHLYRECVVMGGRAYLPSSLDPDELQVFLKPLDHSGEEGVEAGDGRR